MINTVIAVEIAGFCEENANGFRQLDQLIGIAADTNNIVAEVADVGGHHTGSVSLRVDTDQDDSRELASGFDDPRSRDYKLLQRCRANVRAMGKAEKNNTPVSEQLVFAKWLAGMVDHGKIRQSGWRRKYCRKFDLSPASLEGQKQDDGNAGGCEASNSGGGEAGNAGGGEAGDDGGVKADNAGGGKTDNTIGGETDDARGGKTDDARGGEGVGNDQVHDEDRFGDDWILGDDE